MLKKFEKFEIKNKKKNAIIGGVSGNPGGAFSVQIRGVNTMNLQQSTNMR